jgi:galactoside O-acetyltransferase
VILKNIRHRLKLAATNLRVVARWDVLLEAGVTIKYADSITFGDHCTIQAASYLYGSRSGNRVKIGNGVVIASNCMLMGEGGLTIGDNTHLGPGVVLTTQYGDSTSDMSSPDTKLKYVPIKIGRGCWVTSGSIVMPGTVLGDNCIVAPNSVVFGVWPARTTLSGNPARRVVNNFRK